MCAAVLLFCHLRGHATPILNNVDSRQLWDRRKPCSKFGPVSISLTQMNHYFEFLPRTVTMSSWHGHGKKADAESLDAAVGNENANVRSEDLE